MNAPPLKCVVPGCGRNLVRHCVVHGWPGQPDAAAAPTAEAQMCWNCDDEIERCTAHHPEYGFTCLLPPGHPWPHFDDAGGYWDMKGQLGPLPRNGSRVVQADEHGRPTATAERWLAVDDSVAAPTAGPHLDELVRHAAQHGLYESTAEPVAIERLPVAPSAEAIERAARAAAKAWYIGEVVPASGDEFDEWHEIDEWREVVRAVVAALGGQDPKDGERS